jgi:hypothetical protein
MLGNGGRGGSEIERNKSGLSSFEYQRLRVKQEGQKLVDIVDIIGYINFVPKFTSTFFNLPGLIKVLTATECCRLI